MTKIYQLKRLVGAQGLRPIRQILKRDRAAPAFG